MTVNKSEYRRAFIMLRPAVPGWSGHARLEKRVMTGSLYFIINAPERGGTLNAALVGRRGSDYYAAGLGALKRDDRGQLTLAATFDPRLIDGRPLEAYPWLAVAQVETGDCRIVLTGNVDGAHPMDAAAARDAVCALYVSAAPAADLPVPEMSAGADERPPAPETPSAGTRVMQDAGVGTLVPHAALPAPTELLPAPSDLPAEAAPPENAPVEAGGTQPVEASPAGSGMADPPAEAQPDDGGRAAETACDLPQQAESVPEARDMPAETLDGGAQRTRIYTRMRVQSGEATAAPEGGEGRGGTSAPNDTTPALRWRVAAERDRSPACAMPLEDGYTYVRAPLPAACGAEYCLLGIRTDGERLRSVRIAYPGAYAQNPPEGLSGSVWLGPAGGGAGYWVATLACPDL